MLRCVSVLVISVDLTQILQGYFTSPEAIIWLPLTHIPQGYFTSPEAIIWLPAVSLK